MPRFATASIRNLCFVGNSGVGKTTLVEAILKHAGAIQTAGSVERGSTVSDFDAHEKARRSRSFRALFEIFEGSGGGLRGLLQFALHLQRGGRQLLVARVEERVRPALADPGRCGKAGFRHRCGPPVARSPGLRQTRAARFHGLLLRGRRGAVARLVGPRERGARGGVQQPALEARRLA